MYPGITLRDYQVEGINWLSRSYGSLEGCILADEMGLGKTCQTIGFIKQIKGLHLILSPLSVLDNWKKELKRFWSQDLPCLCLVGDKDTRKNLKSSFKSSKFRVLLTTYEIYLKDEEFFKNIDFEWVISKYFFLIRYKRSLIFYIL